MDLRLRFITTPPPKLLISTVLFIRDRKVSAQTHNSDCLGIFLRYFEEGYSHKVNKFGRRIFEKNDIYMIF